MSDFFKNMTNGYYDTKGLCFANWVLKERRKHLLNACILEEEDKRRVKGRNIMDALGAMEEEIQLLHPNVEEADVKEEEKIGSEDGTEKESEEVSDL